MLEKRRQMKMAIGMISGLLVVALMIGYLIRPKYQIDLQAESAYVYNLTDDKEEFALKENKRRKPASLVKIMTVFTGLQKMDSISKVAPIDKKSYQDLVKRNASMAGFYGNEKTIYRDLFYGAMLPSGSECAASIAINTMGSEKRFVDTMNDELRKMNVTNTHFTNPDGLDDNDQFTTAKDIAMILKHSLKNQDFRTIFTKKAYTSSVTPNHPKGIRMESTVFKALKDQPTKGFEILGGKSGTTFGAGLCWATLAQKNGKEYIVVVMGVPFQDLKDHGYGQRDDTIKLLKAIP